MEKNINKILEESRKKNQESKAHLQQLEQAMDAFKTEKIDALAIADKKELTVFSQKESDETYRNLIEKMHEGAVMLDEYGTILYSNFYFANIVRVPLQKVIGGVFKNFINYPLRRRFAYLLKRSSMQAVTEEMYLRTKDKKIVPVLMSLNSFMLDHIFVSSIILSDLTIQNKNKEELRNTNIELQDNARLLRRRDEELKSINNDLLHLNQDLEKRVFERTS